MKKFFISIFVVILIGLSGFIISGFIFSENKIVVENEKQIAAVESFVDDFEKQDLEKLEDLGNLEEAGDSEIVLMAVGDIMLARGVGYMVEKYGQGDFKFPFLKIIDKLNEADIVLGNLESIISDKGTNLGSIYSFRAVSEAIRGLTFSGFDIVSVANNHIFDYGIEAMEDSLMRLKKSHIDYVGGGFSEEEVRSGATKELKGTEITFLAYTDKGSEEWRAGEHSSGIGWLNEDICQDIKKAKEKSDITIVLLHFGDEYAKGANIGQRYFSHLAVDCGADLVVGSHPHIIQPLERYKNAWIAYSLGNFIFDQGHIEGTMEGLLLEIIIKDKKIETVKPQKIKISERFQPFIF